MKINHIIAFAIHGILGKSIESDINLISIDSPCVQAVLTNSPTRYLLMIDQGFAVKDLMMKGVLNNLSEEDRVEIISREMTEIQNRTIERAKGAAILVIEISDEKDIQISGIQKEIGNFIVDVDAIDKGTLKIQHEQIISSIVASLPLSLQQIEPIEKLREGKYLIDSSGKIHYPVTFTVFPVSVRVSRLITQDMIEKAIIYGNSLLQNRDLLRVVHLFNQSILEEGDRLKSFIDAWNSLEIFINKTFSMYETSLLSEIQQSNPTQSVDIFVKRISDVMKNKYSLLDKFNVVSHFLSSKHTQENMEKFKTIKKTRDHLFHGQDIQDSDFPITETQQLLKQYLTKHLEMSFDHNKGFSS